MLYSFLVIKKSDYIADKNPELGKSGGTESRLMEKSKKIKKYGNKISKKKKKY
jgi:hypothetical protein